MTSLSCPIQAECGGCGLMPLSLPAQHDAKLQRLAVALAQHGLAQRPVSLASSPHTFGYRNRIRLRIDDTGAIRFFNHYKQPSCAVLEPKLRGRLSALLERSREAPELFAPFAHLELRSDDDLGRPGLALAGSALAGSELLEATAKLAPVLDGYLLGVRGDPEIDRQQRGIVDGLSAFVPLDGFLQINSGVNALLVKALRAGAIERGARSVLDLYAGSGNFAIPLAAGGLEVCAVEIHPPAVRALRHAVSAQGLCCEAYAEPTLSACQRLNDEGRRFDVIVLDAPRAGARDAVNSVARLGARSVAICSCNPETLARDLADFRRLGFELEELRAFDMFPHTHHLEALAWLTRR